MYRVFIQFYEDSILTVGETKYLQDPTFVSDTIAELAWAAIANSQRQWGREGLFRKKYQCKWVRWTLGWIKMCLYSWVWWMGEGVLRLWGWGGGGKWHINIPVNDTGHVAVAQCKQLSPAAFDLLSYFGWEQRMKWNWIRKEVTVDKKVQCMSMDMCATVTKTRRNWSVFWKWQQTVGR